MQIFRTRRRRLQLCGRLATELDTLMCSRVKNSTSTIKSGVNRGVEVRGEGGGGLRVGWRPANDDAAAGSLSLIHQFVLI